ncbi:hypothetical protein [Nitratifractor sp.]
MGRKQTVRVAAVVLIFSGWLTAGSEGGGFQERLLCLDPVHDPQSCLKKVRALSVKKGGLDRALQASARLYKAHPEGEYRTEYARLLYWKGNLDKAWKIAQQFDRNDPEQSDLYGKISIAYHNKVLKRLRKTPNRYLSYLKTIPKKEQDSYDIKVLTIGVLADLGRVHEAIGAARELMHAYPKSDEPKGILAALLFRDKQYEASRNLYRSLVRTTHNPDYQQALKQVEKAIVDRTLEDANKRIGTALKKRDFDEARSVYRSLHTRRLAKLFDQRYRNTACKVTSIHMAGMGVESYDAPDGRPDNVRFVEGTFPVGKTIIYARAEDIRRYGDEDAKVSAEVYPILPETYWGFLELSKTFDPDFSSRYVIGSHLFKDIGNWELGLSAVYSRYNDDQTTSLSGEYSYSLSDYLTMRQKFSYILQKGNYSILNELHYETPCHVDYVLSYTYSHSKEEVADTDEYDSAISHNLEAGLEYPIVRGLSVGGKVFYRKNINPNYSSIRRGASVSIRKYW